MSKYVVDTSSFQIMVINGVQIARAAIENSEIVLMYRRNSRGNLTPLHNHVVVEHDGWLQFNNWIVKNLPNPVIENGPQHTVKKLEPWWKKLPQAKPQGGMWYNKD